MPACDGAGVCVVEGAGAAGSSTRTTCGPAPCPVNDTVGSTIPPHRVGRCGVAHVARAGHRWLSRVCARPGHRARPGPRARTASSSAMRGGRVGDKLQHAHGGTVSGTRTRVRGMPPPMGHHVLTLSIPVWKQSGKKNTATSCYGTQIPTCNSMFDWQMETCVLQLACSKIRHACSYIAHACRYV